MPKGKKRKAIQEVIMSPKALQDFGIQYSISSLATCRGCRELILKREIRCKKVIYDTEVGIRCGGQALWHHLECFAKVNSFWGTQLYRTQYNLEIFQLKTKLGWFAGGEQLPGYASLSAKDQTLVKLTIW